ncbi:MAG: hypothetical protein KI793_19790 [Rivularia sp. (in: Bacteria)]|nr:hypothetical protein [Rivularia sp. MS3]
MKLQPRKIIFIGSILLVGALIQALPLKAHERRFHVPKKTNEPKTEKVIPETKINSNSSNSSQTSEINKPEVIDNNSLEEEKNTGNKTLNSVNASEANNISLVPKPGEIIFSLLIGGTLLLYYIKQKIYK